MAERLGIRVPIADRPGTDWRAYAQVYDLMAAHNPAYLDLLVRFRTVVHDWKLPPGAHLVDLGAGTGNFSLELARAFPASPVTHLDSNAGMNEQAERKALQSGCHNLRVLTRDIADAIGDAQALFAPGSLSAVTTVHALYAFPDPPAVLAAAYRWLKPGGHLLACDAGRMSSVLGWAAYVLAHHARRHGMLASWRFYLQARSVATLNRPLRQAQREGRLWRHTSAQFSAAIEAAGFEVLQAHEVYRGNSDFVVARKPA